MDWIKKLFGFKRKKTSKGEIEALKSKINELDSIIQKIANDIEKKKEDIKTTKERGWLTMAGAYKIDLKIFRRRLKSRTEEYKKLKEQLENLEN